MRIKEMADLAGTTPRAVRHYHQLGLLDVPPTVRGRREYGVEHLARLLRIRWLAGGGLPLPRVADMLAADESGTDRDSVLHDLRAARRSIDEQQRALREQAERIDGLIAQVADGGTLSPLPTVLARFYDDLEDRIRASERAGSDGGLQVLRTERRLMMILASRGMVPDSAGPFVEELDDAERDECVRQVIAFARLDETDEAGALALAQDTWELTLRHKEQALAVMDDLPGGPFGRALWRLAEVLAGISYSQNAQRIFTARLFELMLADPDLAATIRRSAGEEHPVL
ncbi:MerR family transcriptional regulator [Propionibacterium australiense]|uniref:DNA-binding domain n=1 Tax=Propionibacterium australiense TaxID=119981 RepID=A0A383S5D2_9ACTN|nr:MerR family transcriptional regulator [Propionibacterium australiense]RLP10016.1 MerR family transcriptional regulator [Propionibacterium australiense]RLP11301.1 MerR family transcriptional regulator [Propionibacterium australiense]SYZ32931.1 Putative DNA-binding domain [Propionibacterium australiense]VEH92407.1 Transcriptional regulator, effector-binding domain/component [Propionibacterium australiense]